MIKLFDSRDIVIVDDLEDGNFVVFQIHINHFVIIIFYYEILHAVLLFVCFYNFLFLYDDDFFIFYWPISFLFCFYSILINLIPSRSLLVQSQRFYQCTYTNMIIFGNYVSKLGQYISLLATKFLLEDTYEYFIIHYNMLFLHMTYTSMFYFYALLYVYWSS